MKKLIVITLTLSLLTGCTLTPQQRQAWQDFHLQAKAVATAVMPVALAAGAYSDVQNSRSLRRISKK